MSSFKHAIALTGGIATGKSTIAKILSFNGFSIIDCDKIAHEVLDENYKNIAKMFGDEFVNKNSNSNNQDNQYIKYHKNTIKHKQINKINRAKLAKLIFNNPSKKKN